MNQILQSPVSQLRERSSRKNRDRGVKKEECRQMQVPASEHRSVSSSIFHHLRPGRLFLRGTLLPSRLEASSSEQEKPTGLEAFGVAIFLDFTRLWTHLSLFFIRLPWFSQLSPISNNSPTTARELQLMNPSAAFPKAAGLPVRLLRAPSTCSTQAAGQHVCSANHKRGYHATASNPPARRLREGVYKKKSFIAPSVRVGDCFGQPLPAFYRCCAMC